MKDLEQKLDALLTTINRARAVQFYAPSGADAVSTLPIQEYYEIRGREFSRGHPRLAEVLEYARTLFHGKPGHGITQNKDVLFTAKHRNDFRLALFDHPRKRDNAFAGSRNDLYERLNETWFPSAQPDQDEFPLASFEEMLLKIVEVLDYALSVPSVYDPEVHSRINNDSFLESAGIDINRSKGDVYLGFRMDKDPEVDRKDKFRFGYFTDPDFSAESFTPLVLTLDQMASLLSGDTEFKERTINSVALFSGFGDYRPALDVFTKSLKTIEVQQSDEYSSLTASTGVLRNYVLALFDGLRAIEHDLLNTLTLTGPNLSVMDSMNLGPESPDYEYLITGLLKNLTTISLVAKTMGYMCAKGPGGKSSPYVSTMPSAQLEVLLHNQIEKKMEENKARNGKNHFDDLEFIDDLHQDISMLEFMHHLQAGKNAAKYSTGKIRFRMEKSKGNSLGTEALYPEAGYRVHHVENRFTQHEIEAGTAGLRPPINMCAQIFGPYTSAGTGFGLHALMKLTQIASLYRDITFKLDESDNVLPVPNIDPKETIKNSACYTEVTSMVPRGRYGSEQAGEISPVPYYGTSVIPREDTINPHDRIPVKIIGIPNRVPDIMESPVNGTTVSLYIREDLPISHSPG